MLLRTAHAFALNHASTVSAMQHNCSATATCAMQQHAKVIPKLMLTAKHITAVLLAGRQCVVNNVNNMHMCVIGGRLNGRARALPHQRPANRATQQQIFSKD